MRTINLGNTTLRRRDILALMGAAAATGALGLPALAQEAKKGGVLKVAAPANPSSLDPATGGAGSDHSILWTMYDTLVTWDYETLKPKPGMAKWAFPDPKTMVLDITAGIKFHDGTPLDAEAVKFNMDRNRTDQRSNIKPDLSSVEAVEVTGPLQVTLKLKNPDTALPAIFSDRAGMMVSPTNIKALGNETDRKPVGAGPWKFVRWNDNEIIVVTRHEDYWQKGRPYLDGIEFNIIPENATALRSVVAGQNDMAFQLPARLKPVIERAKNLTLVSAPTLYCVQLYINYGRAPLDNLKVRQAINFALDRDAFVKATLGGLGEPARMTLPSSHWAFNKEVAGMYPSNPDKARELLAEAGYKDGIELTIGGYMDQDSVRRGGPTRQGGHPPQIYPRHDRRNQRAVLRHREEIRPAGLGLDRTSGPEHDLRAELRQRRLLQCRAHRRAGAFQAHPGESRQRGPRQARRGVRQDPALHRGKRPLGAARLPVRD
jgi:ABC-type transport system substrate-binding protein